VPAIQPYIIEPIWEQFAALLPERKTDHPLGCHQHRQSHGGKQHYGASHKQSRLPCKWGGVSSVVRLDSRRPFISNVRSILLYRGRRITQMSYLCGYLAVACG